MQLNDVMKHKDAGCTMQARSQGGGSGGSNEPPQLGNCGPPDSCIVALYTQQQSLMIFTANLSTTTHLAALPVEWLLYVNCYIPPNQHQTASIQYMVVG